MTAWRRALAVLLAQAAFMALPGVPCVALAVQAKALRSKCSTSSCQAPKVVLRCSTVRCCDAGPAESPTAARRADDVVLPPAATRAVPVAVAFAGHDRSAPATSLPAFHGPLILRL